MQLSKLIETLTDPRMAVHGSPTTVRHLRCGGAVLVRPFKYGVAFSDGTQEYAYRCCNTLTGKYEVHRCNEKENDFGRTVLFSDEVDHNWLKTKVEEAVGG